MAFFKPHNNGHPPINSYGAPMNVPQVLRDLVIVHNHENPYRDGNAFNNGGAQMVQLLAAVVAEQRVLLEEHRTMRNEALKLAEMVITEKNNLIGTEKENLQIADNSNVNIQADNASYEILDGENKEMANEVSNSDRIKNSILGQIQSGRRLPYYAEGRAKGMKENMIIFAPIVFTIRDDFWRDRVRCIIKKDYADSNGGMRRLPNQQNNPAVIVVLYNKNIYPIEIIAVIQDSLESYLSEEGIQTQSGKYREKIFSIESIIYHMRNNYNIKLHDFHIMIEPELKDAPPFVLIHKGNTGITADLIKIRPVLSFTKEEQRIAIETYKRSLFHITK
jgi:hypothetical protein